MRNVEIDRSRGDVAVVTLNRPDRLNALSVELVTELREAAREIHRDRTVRVAVLRGAGRGFCAGADLKGDGGRVPGTEAMGELGYIYKMQENLAETILALHECEKPFVAAVHGAAVGGGSDRDAARDRPRYDDWLDHAMDCWVAQLGVVTEQHLAVAGSTTLRLGAKGKVSLASGDVLRAHELAPFIVDMENNGRLSASGNFRTQESDLAALVEDHLPEARRRWGAQNRAVDVAIYAHGGLTDEAAAAATASRWIPALYDARIFPIFLMWETDLWSTVTSRLEDHVADVALRTGSVRENLRLWWNQRLERWLAPIGSKLWDEMKQNALQISENPRSGARLLQEKLRAATRPDRVRLHLVGHSAGAILHSHLAKRLAADGWPIESVTFLAPAVTVEVFSKTLLPEVEAGRVRRYRQFHLTDDAEKKDPTCAPYGRSLLYLVSVSFEHGARTPILGMEIYFQQLAARRRERQAWATAAPSDASRSTTHGGFDGDAATMQSVIDAIRRPPAGAGARTGSRSTARPGAAAPNRAAYARSRTV